MIIDQLYTTCLAQGAYFIESDGEVAVIDPLREVKSYLERAKESGSKIKYIFETHFHADFVSGHVTLSRRTGAPIIYGPLANPTFDAIIAEDGQEFELGKVKIKVLHTPGHTMESTTYLLIDENGENNAIFTGDTLFLGDVGRPDLAQKEGHLTQEDLAGFLFESLRTKIMPLENHLTVYPAHGAGSACGKNMMTETIDTLGNQKNVNYALRKDMTKAEFIAEVTDGLQPPPAYFPANVQLNRNGYQDVDELLQVESNALSAVDFDLACSRSNTIVLDVRNHREFVKAHIPGSISIGLNGTFALWVGTLIKDITTPLLLVTEADDEIPQVITRLARVGFDCVQGYLKGGFLSWKLTGLPVSELASWSVADMESEQKKDIGYPVIDVRRLGEFETNHLNGAIHIPLKDLADHFAQIPRDQPFFIHCRTGYRSVIAASILISEGFEQVIDVDGGFLAIESSSLAFEQSATKCQSETNSIQFKSSRLFDH